MVKKCRFKKNRPEPSILARGIEVFQETQLVSCLVARETGDHFVSSLIQFTFAVADPRLERWLIP